MLWICDKMSFARVDYQLGLNAEGLQCVPELIGLQHRALGIHFADQD